MVSFRGGFRPLRPQTRLGCRLRIAGFQPLSSRSRLGCDSAGALLRVGWAGSNKHESCNRCHGHECVTHSCLPIESSVLHSATIVAAVLLVYEASHTT